MLPVILILILIAVLFGAGLAVHTLWWVAVVALLLFLIGSAMRRGGHRRRTLHW